MTKMYYSFDDGNLYQLDGRYDLALVMHAFSQDDFNGVLIHAGKNKLELVEYNEGREVEFDTRLIIDLGTTVAVTRSKRIVKDGE